MSSVTLCDLFPFSRLIPTHWHQEEPLGFQEEPLGCSVFAETNQLFKRDVYITAYLATMLQASWHIAEGN